jgi:hypothetical protein
VEGILGRWDSATEAERLRAMKYAPTRALGKKM